MKKNISKLMLIAFFLKFFDSNAQKGFVGPDVSSTHSQVGFNKEPIYQNIGKNGKPLAQEPVYMDPNNLKLREPSVEIRGQKPEETIYAQIRLPERTIKESSIIPDPRSFDKSDPNVIYSTPNKLKKQTYSQSFNKEEPIYQNATIINDSNRNLVVKPKPSPRPDMKTLSKSDNFERLKDQKVIQNMQQEAQTPPPLPLRPKNLLPIQTPKNDSESLVNKNNNQSLPIVTPKPSPRPDMKKQSKSDIFGTSEEQKVIKDMQQEAQTPPRLPEIPTKESSTLLDSRSFDKQEDPNAIYSTVNKGKDKIQTPPPSLPEKLQNSKPSFWSRTKKRLFGSK